MSIHDIRGSGGGLGYNPAPSGGGNAKGTAQGVVADNTLRSNAFARIVELIGEGPIVGLVNGGTSIYFNKTPVVNADGTVNFRGVQWTGLTGLPDQGALPGNATSSTQIPVGIQVQFNVAPPVVTVVDPNVTSVQVIVSIPALYAEDNNGNVSPTSVSWQVQVQPHGGAYQVLDTVNINNQKCMSLYQHQSVVTLPVGGAPWNLRVVRLTADSTTTNLANITAWDSYTEIISGSFTYPNSAVVGLTVDAELFQSGSIPARSFHVKGLIIQVPSNYNPTTRVYTGVWDGTFQTAYTNNPAWILYDIITNSRYGIGDYIDASKIDKWGLYTISQYCDQLVPDGYGGQEPRYVFNGVLNNRMEAWKAIQSITSCFRGMTYWATGQVFASPDMPSDPVKLVSPANVIDGRFNYSGTGLKTRHSVAMVRWNDPVTLYQPTVEVVVNDVQLQKFGWREVNFTAIGCTSRGQANRMGRWILDTEQNATETIEYSCSWDHVDIRPGDIIAVADPNKNQIRLGGRIQSVSGQVVGLDAAFTPTAGQSYSLMLELPNGTIATHAINAFTSNNMHAVLNVTLGAQQVVGNMYIITASDVEPRQYRVSNISEVEKNIFKVTAIVYDPTKYARVELAITLPVIPYSLPKTTIDPPNNFNVKETVYFANGVAHNRVTLSWTPSDDFMASSYSITGQSPNGGSVTSIGSTSATSFDIDDAALGNWTYYIQSVGIDGRVSTYVSIAFTIQGWASTAPPYVSNLEIFDQATDLTFTGTDCHLTWTDNFPGSTKDVGQEAVVGTGNANPFYRNDVITVIDAGTGTTLRQEVIYTEDYVYTYAKNVSDNNAYNRGPQRKFTATVTVEDTLGRTSAPQSITVSNPAPDIMAPTLTSAASNIYISWVNAPDPDYVGCIVWASLDPNFDPIATPPVYQGSNNFFVYPGIVNAIYYVRIAGYDKFGTSGLNIGPAVQILCDGFQPDVIPPAIPTNLSLVSAPLTMPTGEIVQTLTASWDASPSDNFAYFEVAIATLGGTFISNQTSINTYTFANGIVSGATYVVQVRAWSEAGFESSYSATKQIMVGPKNVAPGVTTSFAISASLKAAYLFWTNPGDADLDHIEIYQGLTSTFSAAALVGTSFGTAFTVSGLTTGTTYYYWLRAVNTSKIPGAFTGPVSVAPGVLVNSDVGPSSITADRLVTKTITSTQISDGAISTPQLAANSVTAAKIVANTITANEIAANTITANEIATGTITASQIAAGTITADRLVAGTITGNEINVNTTFPATILIGGTGITLGGAAAGGADPAARINTGTTLIAPGLIQLTGATTLSSWQSGADATKINGGFIGANTISANALTIGNRGVTFTGLGFSFVSANSSMSWAAGAASYMSDAGTYTSVSIAAGSSAGYTGSTIYVYWMKDATSLSSSTTNPTAANVIIIATFSTGSGMVVTYGATQIDGSNIVAATIQATKIAAGTITATQIQAGTITATQIATGTITAANILGNTITANKLAVGAAVGNLAVGSITGTLIANGTIDTAQLAANSITAGKIAAGAITASSLGVTTLSAITANVGTLNAGAIYSANSLMLISLDGNYIVISDS